MSIVQLTEQAPTFTVTETKTHTLREGWGVEVTPISAGDDMPDPDAVVDLDVTIVRIDATTVEVHHGAPMVRIGSHAFVPALAFLDEGDANEGDARWFATLDEATEYADDMRQRAAAIRSWSD